MTHIIKRWWTTWTGVSFRAESFCDGWGWDFVDVKLQELFIDIDAMTNLIGLVSLYMENSGLLPHLWSGTVVDFQAQ